MPTNSYDLVVLGDDLAALVCATLCQRRKLRTLVLGDDRPARYTLGPHKLPIEPVLWPSGAGTAGERVLKELHAELGLRRALRTPKIAAQLVAPDLRIDLGGDRLEAELVRELGKGPAESWLALWQQASEISKQLEPLVASEHAFPGVGFFERRETARIADQLQVTAADWWAVAQTNSHAGLWHALAAVALRTPAVAPVAMARAIDAWRAGPSPMRGDSDALRELLREKLATAGGEVRSGQVAELGLSWGGKISTLTLTTGDEIGVGQIVASRPPAELTALFGKKAPKQLTALDTSVALVGYRYTLNLVLDEAGLPEHMAPTVAVLSSPDKDASGDAAFSIHLGEPDDTGRVIATVAAILPSDRALDDDRHSAQVTALRARLWNRLGEVMPFFDRHLVLAHSPHEATPPHVPGGRGSYDVPRNLPIAMAPVWRGQLPNTAELGALTYTTGVKNLTLTGDQIVPGLGMEGALVAGWSAAKVACAIAGKKQDYLKDEIVGASRG